VRVRGRVKVRGRVRVTVKVRATVTVRVRVRVGVEVRVNDKNHSLCFSPSFEGGARVVADTYIYIYT